MAPKPRPNPTASFQSAIRTFLICANPRVAPLSKTPVRRPMYSHNIGSEINLGNKSRTLSITVGVGREAIDLHTIPTTQAKAPHKKNLKAVLLCCLQ